MKTEYTVIDAIKQLIEHIDPEEKVLCSIWTEGDFQACASEMSLEELTPTEVRDAMAVIEHDFSATAGVNWDVIKEAISEVKGGVTIE